MKKILYLAITLFLIIEISAQEIKVYVDPYVTKEINSKWENLVNSIEQIDSNYLITKKPKKIWIIKDNYINSIAITHSGKNGTSKFDLVKIKCNVGDFNEDFIIKLAEIESDLYFTLKSENIWSNEMEFEPPIIRNDILIYALIYKRFLDLDDLISVL